LKLRAGALTVCTTAGQEPPMSQTSAETIYLKDYAPFGWTVEEVHLR